LAKHREQCPFAFDVDQRPAFMKPRRALARIRYELVSLLLECVIAVAVLAAVVAIIPMTLILAAQLHGLLTTGNWRGFQFSEFLDVFRIDLSGPGDTQPVAGFLLALPATLLLFLATLVLCLLAGVLHRLNRRERARFNSSRQNALIKDIERELETR
jgi:cbb3-type cytochrome oxidase subunit 3